MKLFLDESQIKALLLLSEVSARDWALFHVALSTGFRVSDLVSIRRVDVTDADGEVVRVLRLKMQKTGKYIERPLRDDCRVAIGCYLRTRHDTNPYLFRPHSHNSQGLTAKMNRSSVHRIYRHYLEMLFPKSQLRGNSCHVTRRSVAKLISLRTGRIEPATEFLGHGSVATTMAYIDKDYFGRQADDAVKSLNW